jgi:hypothetical protein
MHPEPGILMAQDYSYWVELDGKKAAEVKWTVSTKDDPVVAGTKESDG